MAAKTSWHKHGTKLRHCHPMYTKKSRNMRGSKCKKEKYKKKVIGCCLSTLMAVRLSIEAVQHMTSSATHMSHSASPSSHIALFTCNHGNDAPALSMGCVDNHGLGWVGFTTAKVLEM